jgi:Tfp pilus assembly major pilin PilA
MDSIESAALWVDTQPAAANDVATTTRDATQWVLFTAVVALAGVIAAVALPTYRDYTSRQNQSAGGQAAIAPAAPSTSPTNAKPWAAYQRQAQVEADLKPFQGKTDQEITQAWSGNQFERFESVAAIEARARRYTVLDRQDAWTAVTEWQAYYMHDGKTGANEALYLAVGTVLSGFSAHKGICRPAITVVNSATAGDAFPVGAVLARLDCERE